VYDNPDLEKTVRVSGEGAIVLPLIGEIAVEGLSVTAVTQRITGLLADGYLINPHVSVFVEEFRSKKATILGEVNRPGLYEISGEITFLEMVSKAQGFTKNRRQPGDHQNGDSSPDRRRRRSSGSICRIL